MTARARPVRRPVDSRGALVIQLMTRRSGRGYLSTRAGGRWAAALGGWRWFVSGPPENRNAGSPCGLYQFFNKRKTCYLRPWKPLTGSPIGGTRGGCPSQAVTRCSPFSLKSQWRPPAKTKAAIGKVCFARPTGEGRLRRGPPFGCFPLAAGTLVFIGSSRRTHRQQLRVHRYTTK